ncbi:uncharacterized protein LOC109858829 [Pseudomyrmex gracilis]|uniref:uncharacterized protein LOC109858829 n=1 Tax=Pseudomyrmex gracilis TaxID=219809 RepID=UPI000995A1DC|nr:uncharacterized protein LOC109858829 [Pseudomyrmex gracilis]XP_020292057.1 uncharacterized protein LOC109858829 [Pseudomyrmex gracilis]XP_020292058.1 uncharacterized protein LOC109858829 [Pseudomyrmex gracilis]XP_020292059.1 uncharacterized protein LOC109858829 [Pseudomyrmex gracilis]XP_020292060.1 uncharacterized protein LOC109858829 [Pseudomyrmex gracilis]XP_020292061.1 uncharacterized protein LOC109858829 [Pseudomyrmex gracilis]
MKIGLLKNFMYYFNLRQGTILIAIFQLFSSGLSMIFFIMALIHGMRNLEKVVKDTEDALEREALEEISNHFHANAKIMDMAHHNATEMVYAMYCGLVITVIHFISTMLLLYGALTNNRHFMAPWMMVKITIIAALAISLFLVEEDCPFLAILGGRAGICERLIAFFLIITSFYIWFVVYSTYKSLETKKGLMHEMHSVKKKYAVSVPLEVPKEIQISANKAYEL